MVIPVNPWLAAEGASAPLGASWVAAEQAWNFALYSRHATGVWLLLYTEQNLAVPAYELALDYQQHKSSRVWHCRVPAAGLPAVRYYAYRVAGPDQPAAGHRFEADKILLDPYAREVFFPPGFSHAAARRPGSTAGQAPLGVLPTAEAAFDWGDDQRPVHTADTIIYELHVRGFTQHPSSGVSAERRGTFAGIIDKIPYLQDLGVTVVELLPVQQFDPQQHNYWGYMTLNFFAPHRSYASDKTPGGARREFRQLVKALHAAGIEIVLDVVYNHTAELGADGPTYSFRGIDNSTYYLLDKNNFAVYNNDSGTGNVLRTAHPAGRKLVVDSLRYWVKEMRVDGLRFDLASIFTRNEDGSINLDDPPVISEISSHPDFADVRLIAEAWDITTYQLGRSFPGLTWGQWNGKFRDDVRGFVKSDNGLVPSLMQRLLGSPDLFPDDIANAYHPYQSINFITAHDGFCLYDLVAYNTKHNDQNGENNRDGSDDNRSWNCGWEGDADVPAEVLALRRRQTKNFATLLLLANGTPMLVAGDEFAHTQHGNNNPYNQDNETTWLDWNKLKQNQDLFRFFKQLIAFRKAHPTLGRSRAWGHDLTWYGPQGAPDTGYFSHTLAFCLHGDAQHDATLYVLINAYWEALPFAIQEGEAGDWQLALDTALPSPQDITEPGHELPLPQLSYTVQPRSVVVLKRGRN